MSYCASNGIYFDSGKRLFRAEVRLGGSRICRKFKLRQIAAAWIGMMKRYGYAARHVKPRVR